MAVDRPRGVELGDANDDGLLDVFVGTVGEGVSVLLQTASGTLMRPCWRHAGHVEGSKSIAVGDINSDERLDAVVVGGFAGLRLLKQIDPNRKSRYRSPTPR